MRDICSSSLSKDVLCFNPLLEALGNAVTVMNSNSSRFGKLVCLGMTPEGVDTASMQSYLLEKVRVTRKGPKERSYHIFYQYLSSRSMDSFPHLSFEVDSNIPLPDDAEEWKETQKVLEKIDATSMVTTVLDIILHTSPGTLDPRLLDY